MAAPMNEQTARPFGVAYSLRLRYVGSGDAVKRFAEASVELEEEGIGRIDRDREDERNGSVFVDPAVVTGLADAGDDDYRSWRAIERIKRSSKSGTSSSRRTSRRC